MRQPSDGAQADKDENPAPIILTLHPKAEQ